MIDATLLTLALFGYAAAVVVLTIAAGLAYRRVWVRARGDGTTPTGFGALLALVMPGAALVSQASTELIVSLAIIAVVTAIYWLDDLISLSARLRLFISLLAGIGIGAAWLVGDGLSPLILVAALILAGIVCVVLTNMVNFCDGADLNLASFIALTAAMILLYTPPTHDWVPVAVATLAFILPFAVINSRPRTLYLGDSGSFAFAGLLTAMAVAFVENVANIAPEAAIPAALPTLDVAYVFAIRLIEKHDLMTRNYLHLYQRLNRRYRGFGYLLPQFVNVALCVGVAAALQVAGLGRILSVVIAMVAVTVPFYWLCRRLFLAGPPEGPLYETTR